MRVLIFIAALLPVPAAALEYCEDLWFTRNLVFDRAGYCFGSELGKAVFGNDGCVGKDISLTPAEAALVARVRAREAEANCSVNTGQTVLPVPNQSLRRAMIDLPVATEFESACVNWLYPPVLPLFSAKDVSAPVSASVIPGDTLLFQFEDDDAWRFIEVLRNDRVVAVGWTNDPLDASNCEMWAG